MIDWLLSVTTLSMLSRWPIILQEESIDHILANQVSAIVYDWQVVKCHHTEHAQKLTNHIAGRIRWSHFSQSSLLCMIDWLLSVTTLSMLSRWPIILQEESIDHILANQVSAIVYDWQVVKCHHTEHAQKLTNHIAGRIRWSHFSQSSLCYCVWLAGG